MERRGSQCPSGKTNIGRANESEEDEDYVHVVELPIFLITNGLGHGDAIDVSIFF